MNQVLFEELFAEMAEKFNIAKLCRDNNKDYDLQSMMIALCGKVCNKEPIDEDKLDELAENWNVNYAIHPHMEDYEEYNRNDIVEAFKYGYRKAMEE